MTRKLRLVGVVWFVTYGLLVCLLLREIWLSAVTHTHTAAPLL